MSLHPTPSSVTAAQIRYCLSLYPTVIEKHYTAKIKDAKKRVEAIERDRWRYDKLSSSLDGGGMSLETLERLVQWKITHGHSRPFLPAMIRKNDAERTLHTTGGAATLLANLAKSNNHTQGHVLDVVFKSLDIVSTLSGVGPATASLILSVYAPNDVPYFEDEMFHWLCADLGKEKLKYDKKEYRELFDKLWKLKERLESEVSAIEVERASFVVGHWDLVDEQGRKGMPGGEDHGKSSDLVKTVDRVYAAVRKEGKSKNVAMRTSKSNEFEEPAASTIKSDFGNDSLKSNSANKGVKRGTPKRDTESAPDKASDAGIRRSKRAKK